MVDFASHRGYNQGASHGIGEFCVYNAEIAIDCTTSYLRTNRARLVYSPAVRSSDFLIGRVSFTRGLQ